MTSAEYEQTVQQYADMVWRVAVSCGGNIPDAEDAFQNTFLKLFLYKKGFANEEHKKRWLIRVAVNECKNMHLNFWHRRVDLPGELPEQPVFAQETHTELYEAFRRLPAKCRIVMYLVCVEGYSTAETAKLLSIPDATVRTRLSRARKLLRKLLEDQE